MNDIISFNFKSIPENVNANDIFLIFYNKKLFVKKKSNSLELIQFSDIFNFISKLKINTVFHVNKDSGRDYYCIDIGDNVPEYSECGAEFYDLRSIINFFSPAQFKLASTAAQFIYWEKTSKFCGECGALNEFSTSDRARFCPRCNKNYYPVITPAIITAVMKEKKILLAHNKNFAAGIYSLIAGFVEPGESLEECVRREVLEETGILVKEVKYIKSQSWPFPGNIMIGFYASYESGEIKPDGSEITRAAWFDKNSLPPLPAPGSLSRSIIDSVFSDFY